MPSAALISPVLEALDAPAHIGRVALRVSDLARVGAFYRDVLGLTLRMHDGHAELGTEEGMVLVELIGGAEPVSPQELARAPGLFHTAFLLPSRRDLADWIAHAQTLGVPIEGASDHLVSEAIYLSDPEGNGIEVYADRPRAEWPMEGDAVKMATLPLDGSALMAERGPSGRPWRFPCEGRIGHVHLKVGNLAAGEAFARDQLGLKVMARYPGAVFLSWGGYHHHVGLNVWRSRGAPPRKPGMAGLERVEIARTGIAPWPDGDRLRTEPSGLALAVPA